MDFARFNFLHGNDNYIKPAEGCFYYPEVDDVEMNFVPVSFYHLLESSYHFTDPYIAQSITPDRFDSNGQLDSLRMYLAAAGFIITDQRINFESHFDFANRLTDGQFNELVVDELNIPSLNPENMSYASDHLDKLFKKTNEIVENNTSNTFLLLFYTPAGFSVYWPPKIQLDSVVIGIVVSKTEIFQIKHNQQKIRLRIPSNLTMQAIKPPPPRTFCEFSLIHGTWQPSFKIDMLGAIPIDLSLNSKSSRDCCTVNFNFFAGSKMRILGLIGRFSDIVNLFTGKIKDTLDNIRINLNPYMFYLKNPESSVSYVILYLPSDYMPNHPQYKDVVQYAYTFMRRACTLTLFVPNIDGQPQQMVINNHIQGILKQANAAETFFFGSGKSQILCLRTRPYVQHMEFADLNDFLNWMKWISPQYEFDFSQLQHHVDENGVSFDPSTIFSLIQNENDKNERHFIDHALFGLYGNTMPEELAEIQINDTTEKININMLIDRAVLMTTDGKFARPERRCIVCQNRNRKLSDDDKKALHAETDIKNLCASCCIYKIKATSGSSSQDISAFNRLNNELASYKRRYDDSVSKLISCMTHNPTKPQQEVANFFIEWFFEYWTQYCLEADWESLKEGNYLGLDNFDQVQLDANMHIVNLNNCIEKISDKKLPSTKGKQYFEALAKITMYCAHKLDHEQIFNDFKSSLIEYNTKKRENRRPMEFSQYLAKCKARNQAPKKIPEDTSKIVFKSITATNRMTIDVIVNDDLNTIDFKHYTFHHVNASTDGKFSAEPLQGEKMAELIEQTCKMNIVNAWRVNNGVLVLTAIGNKLRLIFLPANFQGRFVDHYVYETDIADSKFCYAAFAPLTNILCIVSKVKTETQQIRRYIILVQVSLDLTSSVEIRRRPLECLLPLPKTFSEDKPDTIFDGFTINDTASKGVLGASIPGSSPIVSLGKNDENYSEQTENEPIFNEPSEHVLIEFDPMTLSMTTIRNISSRSANISVPVCPLHFHTNKTEDDTIIAVSPDTDLDHFHQIFIFSPENTQIARIKLNGLGDYINNRIGVANYDNQNILVFAHGNQPPTLQQAISNIPMFPNKTDMFYTNFDFASIPKFIAECNSHYGFSEIERAFFPTHMPYPVELVKFDVLDTNTKETDYLEYQNLISEIKVTMSEILPFENWSVPFRIHKKPSDNNMNNLFGRDNYDAVINFITRIMSLPQIFVPSITRAPTSVIKYLDSSISTEATRVMSQFPPLPLLRDTINRNSVTISLVDIGDNDGSGILSSVCGIPFTPSLNGSCRVGGNFAPLFKKGSPLFMTDGFTINNKSVKSFVNIIVAAFKADRPNIIVSNAVTIYCALSCSDLVIVNAGSDTELLLDVINMLIEVIDPLDDQNGRLFYRGEERIETSRRMAFITDLGAAPEAKLADIAGKISYSLTLSQSQFAKNILKGPNTFIPAEMSNFEIARAISNDHLIPIAEKVEKSHDCRTLDAYANIQKAAGYFSSLLSHIDMYMETGADDDNDSDVGSDDDECEEEEEETSNEEEDSNDNEEDD